MRLPVDIAAVVLALCGGSMAATAQPLPVPDWPLRMQNGMESMRYDAESVVVYRGSATDNTGRHLITFPRSVTARIDRIGENGRDNVATPLDLAERRAEMTPDPAAPGGFRPVYREGHPFAGRPLSGWYMPVLASDGRSSSAVFLTRQQSSQGTDRAGDAGVPEAFVARRNAPVAYHYDATHGFRPMVCHGWPQPYCLWTRVPPYTGLLNILSDGRSAQPAEVDARDFVPPTGRILGMQVVVRGVESGGGARLFTVPRGEGLLVGHVPSRGAVAVAFVDLALTSARVFHYAVDPGVSIEINAMGFSMLQPN